MKRTTHSDFSDDSEILKKKGLKKQKRNAAKNNDRFKKRRIIRRNQSSSPLNLAIIVLINMVILVRTRPLITISSIEGISSPVLMKTRREGTLKQRKNETRMIMASRVDSIALLVFIPLRADIEKIAITAASRIMEMIKIFIRF